MSDKESKNKYIREWRKKRPEYVRAQNLMSHYGITLLDWQKMYDKQKGRCKICGKHQSELNQRLHVDHNHVSNKFRCLLCKNCNAHLGWLENHFECIMKILEIDNAK